MCIHIKERTTYIKFKKKKLLAMFIARVHLCDKWRKVIFVNDLAPPRRSLEST